MVTIHCTTRVKDFDNPLTVTGRSSVSNSGIRNVKYRFQYNNYQIAVLFHVNHLHRVCSITCTLYLRITYMIIYNQPSNRKHMFYIFKYLKFLPYILIHTWETLNWTTSLLCLLSYALKLLIEKKRKKHGKSCIFQTNC